MGWSHGKQWSEEDIARELLHVAVTINRVPSYADLKSLNRQDILNAVRRRGGLKKWQETTAERFQLSCGDVGAEMAGASAESISSPQDSSPSLGEHLGHGPCLDAGRAEAETGVSHSCHNDDSDWHNDDSDLQNDDSDLTPDRAVGQGASVICRNDDSDLQNDDSDLTSAMDSMAKESLASDESSHSTSSCEIETSTQTSPSDYDDSDLQVDDSDLTNDDSDLTDDRDNLTYPMAAQFGSNFNQFEANIAMGTATESQPKPSTRKPISYGKLFRNAGLDISQTKSNIPSTAAKKDNGSAALHPKNVSTENHSILDHSIDRYNTTAHQMGLDGIDLGHSHIWTDSEVKVVAARLFLAWVKAAKKSTRTRLTPKKTKIVGARLRQGYSEQDLEQAILGFAASPWHTGQNPQKKEWLDFVWILQDGDKVEQGMGYYTDLVQKPHDAAAAKEERDRLAKERREREAERRRSLLAKRNQSLPQEKRECTDMDLDEVEQMVFGCTEDEEEGESDQ